MNGSVCSMPLAWQDLLAYWLGELEAEREAEVEHHYLGCPWCSERLGELVAFGGGVRVLVNQSAISAVVEDRFVQVLRDQGLRVREYRVPRNGSVNCTVTPEDDVVVGRLEAGLGEVSRLDLEYLHESDHVPERIEDVPFVAGAGAVVMVTRIEALRALPKSTLRVRMLSVDPGGERILGDYAFHHTPHPGPVDD